jgi:hypothetical protein
MRRLFMRGKRDERRPMFFAIDVEDRIRADHPLRPIKSASQRARKKIEEAFGWCKTVAVSISIATKLSMLLMYSCRSTGPS